MKTFISFFLIILITACVGQKNLQQMEQPKPEMTGSVEQIDSSLNEIVDPAAMAEVLDKGFEWSEGPVWSEEHQFLLFSDVWSNSIYRWKEGEGVTEYIRPSGYTGEGPREGELGSNGLIIDQNGNLVICQHGDRSVARMEAPLNDPTAEYTRLAESYDGKRLNSPNDLVQHSSGAIYFTDPAYGLPEQHDDPNKELDFQGVYRINPSGELTLLTDEMSRPNGLAFSPDEQTLYVANSDPNRAIWMAYSVLDDGNITDGRVFYDVTESVGQEPGLPDGMTVDSDGNIYATGPGGVWIFNPEGDLLGKIKTGQATANCTIGNNGNMLYMTADSLLLRMPLK
jgi:gluconolactonase